MVNDPKSTAGGSPTQDAPPRRSLGPRPFIDEQVVSGPVQAPEPPAAPTQDAPPLHHAITCPQNELMRRGAMLPNIYDRCNCQAQLPAIPVQDAPALSRAVFDIAQATAEAITLGDIRALTEVRAKVQDALHKALALDPPAVQDALRTQMLAALKRARTVLYTEAPRPCEEGCGCVIHIVDAAIEAALRRAAGEQP